MFDKILIANRGEIALRVLRACKELGIPTVAVHSTADAEAMHVRFADESVCIGPPAAKDSYLNIPGHPLGLRNHRRRRGASGLRLSVGECALCRNPRRTRRALHRPQARAYPHDGRQDRGQAHRGKLGIPVVPGSEGGVSSDAEAAKIAGEIGYPVLIKAAAGGGGRGMKVARAAGELSIALSTARAEAKAAFGDDAVYMEKYLEKPRHIEIQVLGDGNGKAVHLGERDCSLQRRHQKVWEEGPSPALNAQGARRDRRDGRQGDARDRLSRRRHRRIPLRGRPVLFHRDEHAHPGRAPGDRNDHRHRPDLRADPRRRRQRLTLKQSDIEFRGHAIECRINAENPVSFRPSPGKILHYHPPGGLGVRIDSAVYQGYTIPPFYDSLVGKLIVHGKTRTECLMRLRARSTKWWSTASRPRCPSSGRWCARTDIIDGNYHIHWLEQFLARGGMAELTARRE